MPERASARQTLVQGSLFDIRERLVCDISGSLPAMFNQHLCGKSGSDQIFEQSASSTQKEVRSHIGSEAGEIDCGIEGGWS